MSKRLLIVLVVLSVFSVGMAGAATLSMTDSFLPQQFFVPNVPIEVP